ncbi:MAG: DnaT-like ssDNA-binding domain-containing protein [Luminiphilus sp.]|jgi:hypothetical protein|nr:DnaT-like ssDNA-binding domain-containing protein [Luminiphilus sp.]
MQFGSLIPDRQLTFSPELAATIGLEEAVLLQKLGTRLTGHHWATFDLNSLHQSLPFWSVDHIELLTEKLVALGILVRAAQSGPNQLILRVADTAAAETPTIIGDSTRNTVTQQPDWVPSHALIELLTLNHGIPENAIREAQSSFVPGPGREIDTQFRQHVLGRWQQQQPPRLAFEVRPPPSFGRDWQPSADALDILIQADIDVEFAESVRSEFVLYWSERGGAPKEINSRFVEHVRRRWLRHTSQMHHSTEPTRIPRNWQPDSAVYDTLRLAGISEESARALLPEFVMYWVDSNEVHTSWNSKFLQHVKRQCRPAGEGDQHGGEAGRSNTGSGHRSKDRSLNDDLTDTSWAN